MIDIEKDAFGRVLFDWWREQRSSFEIYERSDGYIAVGDGTPQYFASFPYWSPRQKQAIGLVAGRTLDVGCGAGRHALHLQEQGHEVIAIDVSPLAVDVCKGRGVRDARALSLTVVGTDQADLGTFDTILMLGNNFGLFANAGQTRELLTRWRPLARQIVAETMNPYATDNPVHHAYHAANREQGRMGGQITMRSRYRQYTGDWFDYLYVSQEELHELVAGTGWTIEQIIEGKDSPQYVAVLR